MFFIVASARPSFFSSQSMFTIVAVCFVVLVGTF